MRQGPDRLQPGPLGCPVLRFKEGILPRTTNPRPPLPADLTVGGLSDARRVRADGVDPKTLSACENADETDQEPGGEKKELPPPGYAGRSHASTVLIPILVPHLLSRAALVALPSSPGLTRDVEF